VRGTQHIAVGAVGLLCAHLVAKTIGSDEGAHLGAATQFSASSRHSPSSPVPCGCLLGQPGSFTSGDNLRPYLQVVIFRLTN
jgi:hypothetical protein